MLDKAKMLQELKAQENTLFFTHGVELDAAISRWEHIMADAQLQSALNAVAGVQHLTRWCDPLGKVYPLKACKEYQVISVDGSQIYPDRHQGQPCYLINTGSVTLSYGSGPAIMQRESTPFLFSDRTFDEFDGSAEHVNSKRTELELKTTLRIARSMASRGGIKDIVSLVDGALIFWHLDGKDDAARLAYFDAYNEILYGFYQEKLPIAGYISLPKSKELVALVRAAEKMVGGNLQYQYLVDADLIGAYVPPGFRTGCFEYTGAQRQGYHVESVPHFLFFNAGYEIIRLELPAWAIKQPYIDSILGVVLDQIEKGRGYPVVLAEAHETAVITAADRQFFYQALEKLTVEAGNRYVFSQKSAKKRNKTI